MRMKLGLALVGVMGLALVVGLACTQEAPKDKAAKKKTVPQGMVAVPAGEFIMGMSADEGFKECQRHYKDCKSEGFTKEEPAHKVYLDAFYIDKTEVSQEDYDKCVAAGKCKANHRFEGLTGPRQPVVGVTWDEARSYCSWAGKRLPTEAEWEKAARGTDGRMYPWGNEFDGKKANFCDKNCEMDWAQKKWDDGYARTAPVGSYSTGASPYGALDMAGNAWEWVADWYQKDYYSKGPVKNPKGPDAGTNHVLRGGSWSYLAYDLRVSSRIAYGPAYQGNFDYGFGFRCAGD
jgi:formylglycine-generating enzyme required for sulfatase activity